MTSVLKLGRFEFNPCGVKISGRPSLEQWEGPLSFALWCQRASPWWIGDMLNAGDDSFGEAFFQLCEEYGVSAEMMQRYKGVARRVPAVNRRASLSWSAHAVAARLSHDEQRKVLAEAERRGWTSEEIRRHLRERDDKAKKEQATEADPEVPTDDQATKGETHD
ncbi:hypothetical protein K2Y11_09820 [bacterium]|nr:hypothetical protein [bacterium]